MPAKADHVRCGQKNRVLFEHPVLWRRVFAATLFLLTVFCQLNRAGFF